MLNTITHNFYQVRKKVVDCYRMQRHYGWPGDFIAFLKALRCYFHKQPEGNHKNPFPACGENKNFAVDHVSLPGHRAAAHLKVNNSQALYSPINRLNPEAPDPTGRLQSTAGIFDTPPRITFISYSIPRHGKSSAEFRLYNILHLLLADNCKVDLIYCEKSSHNSKYLQEFNSNVNFLYKPLDLREYIRTVQLTKPDFVWISELWRIAYVEFMAELTRELKSHFKGTRVIVDTVDFHHKLYFRKYKLTNDQNDLTLANEYLKYEKTMYRAADKVVVVSEEEKRDIQCKIDGINCVEIIPNIHEINGNVQPYEKRRNICFIGNFGAKHNFDAVQFFLDRIFQLILKTNPAIEFHVIGYFSENHREAFSGPNVKVVGRLENLQRALTNYKLFVCPLTYGAGMKGKIGDAITAGTPIVTTSIGAEGFPVTDGAECFIADSPLEFAEKCIRCLNDPVLWHNFSLKARLMLAENFSPAAAAQKLGAILSN